MDIQYEMLFLSDLLKKSREKPHEDFLAALNYIYQRLEKITSDSPDSPFNKKIRLLKKILPPFFLPKLLYRLHYDAMIGFCKQGKEKIVYGMISFQKHPSRGKIGMFDIYISPERREKDMVGHFQKLSTMVYQLTQRFQQSGYKYLQCGKNETTKKLLRLYQRMCMRNEWDCIVDVENSRIYLS